MNTFVQVRDSGPLPSSDTGASQPVQGRTSSRSRSMSTGGSPFLRMLPSIGALGGRPRLHVGSAHTQHAGQSHSSLDLSNLDNYLAHNFSHLSPEQLAQHKEQIQNHPEFQNFQTHYQNLSPEHQQQYKKLSPEQKQHLLSQQQNLAYQQEHHALDMQKNHMKIAHEMEEMQTHAFLAHLKLLAQIDKEVGDFILGLFR